MKSTLKIKKGFIMPPRAGYPWPDMEIGDSIAVPRNGMNVRDYALHVSGVIYRGRKWARRNGNSIEFASRKIGSTAHIWRTK